MARVTQRQRRVLLRKQERHALFLIQRAHNLENLVHDLRSQTHRWLIQQHQHRARHDGPADGAHLLLSAAGVTSLRGAARLQTRKQAVDTLQISPHRGPAVGPGIRASHQVFLDRQVPEAATALHHLNTPGPHERRG